VDDFAAIAGGIHVPQEAAVKPVRDDAEQRRAAEGNCQCHQRYMDADHDRGGSRTKPDAPYSETGHRDHGRTHDEGEQHQMAITIHEGPPSSRRRSWLRPVAKHRLGWATFHARLYELLTALPVEEECQGTPGSGLR
jgi:hypothetical protein